MIKIPKTDSEILDYIEKNKVTLVPPRRGNDYWIARDDESTFMARNVRDAVITLAAQFNLSPNL